MVERVKDSEIENYGVVDLDEKVSQPYKSTRI